MSYFFVASELETIVDHNRQLIDLTIKVKYDPEHKYSKWMVKTVSWTRKPTKTHQKSRRKTQKSYNFESPKLKIETFEIGDRKEALSNLNKFHHEMFIIKRWFEITDSKLWKFSSGLQNYIYKNLKPTKLESFQMRITFVSFKLAFKLETIRKVFKAFTVFLQKKGFVA